ncbi:MAG: class I SAM-dependent methyltransferase [Betaproteobacteria bacterium]
MAEDDPYWGVLSQDEYRNAAMDPERFAQFMATGERFVADVFGLVGKTLDKDFAPRRVLDVGCGVGRLLIPMARLVKEAVGVDVAPRMLELARKHVQAAGLDNVTLVAGDDELSAAEGEFDFVNSFIVLQHVPPQRGYRLIQSMIDKARKGGVVSVQVTYAKARSFLQHEAPTALYYRRDGGQIHDILDSGWRPPEGTINMFDYDLNQVMAQVSTAAGHPVIALPTNDDSHLGVHFVFCKAR